MKATKHLASIACLGVALMTLSCTKTATVHLAAVVNPEGIDNSGPTTIWARLTDPAGKPISGKLVSFELTNVEICGQLADQEKPSADAKTDDAGRAKMSFKAAQDVQNCVARIAVRAEGQAQDVVVKVRPAAASAVEKIDGVSALALILIASFAIDRITQGLLFVLSFSRAWRTRIPDEESAARPQLKKRSRLAYLLIAGLLSTVVIAGYGKIRLFASMGFPGINPLLDALLTGLVLVGGADRTEGILKGLGGGEGAPRAPAPLQITGTLTLVDREAMRDAGEAPPLPQSA